MANRVEVQGVGSSTTGYFPQRLSASVAGVPLPREYVAVDLDELSSACHCHVDGLLGVDFFRDRIVQIDFSACKIRLLSQYTPEQTADTLPLKNHHGAYLVPLTVDSATSCWMRLDTGCASALALVDPRGPKEAAQSRLAVALSEVRVAVSSTSVKLGRTAFPSVPTDLHEKEIFRGESGLLGNGLLSRFNTVTIDSKAGRITFAGTPRG